MRETVARNSEDRVMSSGSVSEGRICKSSSFGRERRDMPQLVVMMYLMGRSQLNK